MFHVQIMPLPLTTCVVLDKSLDFTELYVLFYGGLSHSVVEVRNNVHKVLITLPRTY